MCAPGRTVKRRRKRALSAFSRNAEVGMSGKPLNDFSEPPFPNDPRWAMPKPDRLPKGDEPALLAELRVGLVGTQLKRRWNQLVRQPPYLRSADLAGEQRRGVVTDAEGTCIERVVIAW